jgi:soluble lytic murein transglycosylase
VWERKRSEFNTAGAALSKIWWVKLDICTHNGYIDSKKSYLFLRRCEPDLLMLNNHITTWLCLLIFGLISVACTRTGINPQAPTPVSTTSPFPTPIPFTQTPHPTPTPVPTETPVPAVRIASADKAVLNGDWEAAQSEYSAAESSEEPEIRAAAALGLGRVYFATNDHARALSTLRGLIENYPDSSHRASAYLFLGQTYSALTRYEEAAQAYQEYLKLRPGVIDAYILGMKGDALYNLGDYTGALRDFTTALQSPRSGSRIEEQIKTARTYALAGEHATAVVMYEDIYKRSTSDYTRAQVNLLLGQAYTAMGQVEKAYAAYHDSVKNYQLAYDSYLGLIELVNAGYPVNELDRGLVDYFARQHNVAIAAFDRYLSSEPADPATAYYYKGLSLRALGNYHQAIEQWDIVIDQYSGSSLWGNAWEQKAVTLSQNLNDRAGGQQIILDFVSAAPWHAKASELLFRAAREMESQGELVQAAELWERTAVEFPSGQQAFQAMFLAGITHYRLKDYPAALDAFQRSIGMAGNSNNMAAGYLWLGKTQKALGELQSARTSWQQSASLDPTGYYSERARDLLVDRSPFTPPAAIDLGFDPAVEQAEAEAWMRLTFRLPDDVRLSGPGPLLTEGRLQRGTELWHLGLFKQAREEFEDLRIYYEHDPISTYRLANYLQELGLYRSSILAARRVLTLAGMDDASTMNAPMHFNRIRFGTYYSELVIPAAQQYDFHPFLIWSIMRQESFFEPFIGSSAGARGLMQFMPATGQERAERLSWPPNYTSADLDRPIVSITFGANYLDFTKKYLDGDLYGALAAYNGGPGNARAWKDLAQDDPDLFLEIVRFEETRRYIRAISEMYAIYNRLYTRAP